MKNRMFLFWVCLVFGFIAAVLFTACEGEVTSSSLDYYDITYPTLVGGKVTGPAKATPGNRVEVTVALTNAVKYDFYPVNGSVTVEKNYGGLVPAEPTKSNNHIFSFVMPDEKVIVSAIFPKKPAPITSSKAIDDFEWTNTVFPMMPMEANDGQWWGADGTIGPADFNEMDVEVLLPIGPRSGYWIKESDGQVLDTENHTQGGSYAGVAWHAIEEGMVGRVFADDTRNSPATFDGSITGFNAVSVWVKKG